MGQPDGGNLIFDWDLLEGAQRLLDTKPQDAPLQNAMGMSVPVAAFGTAAGGAEAAARLNTWLTGAVADLTVVNTEVVALSASTGDAARIARDLDPATAAIATGNSRIAGAIGDAPELNLGEN